MATFKLVPDTLSTDTIDCVTQLYNEAHQGDLIGMALVALYRGRRYLVHTSGECLRQRTFTRGAVADLDQTMEALR